MLQINLSPFPVLQTNRCKLRRVTAADAPEILFLRSDERVMKYLDREKTTTLAGAADYIKTFDETIDKNEGINWGICLAGQEKLIGTIGLWRFIPAHYRAEIGYSLHPEFWQQGYTSEVLTAVLDYGFKHLHLHSIEANVNPLNLASIALLEKHGFVKEAHFKENYFFQNHFLDSAIYSLLAPAN